MKWETRTRSERENERENEESPNRMGGESRKERESQNGGTTDQTWGRAEGGLEEGADRLGLGERGGNPGCSTQRG